MAVVTTTFTSTAGQNWASSTWSSSDPSKKLHDELVAWVNAINDPTKIEMIHNPGDATARGSNDLVRWLLRAREAETGSDYGFRFAERAAGTSGSASPGIYYSRTAGSSNNGAGSYSSQDIASATYIDLTNAAIHFVAYDASGSTPWFVYAIRDSGNTSVSAMHFLCRLTTQNIGTGSYYPATGLGKWLYAAHSSTNWGANPPCFVTPQSSLAAPYKGVNAGGVGYMNLRFPQPKNTYGDGYFFKLGAQYGDTHFLGEPTYDILVSNSATGVWGDTVVIDSVTYQRLGFPLWVRIS